MNASSVLGIWAHPDDETWMAGGLLAAAARRGARVHCLHMTYGEAGQCAHGPVSPERLGRIREAELTAALKELGVADQQVLGYPDGQLASVPRSQAVEKIQRELVAVQPDVVVTFGPDGFTGHPDHRCLSGWVDAAVAGLGRPDTTVLHAAVPPAWVDSFAAALNEFRIFWPGYPQPTPVSDIDVNVVLDPELLDAKLAALKAHDSQMRPLFAAYGDGFLRALGSAEAFRRSAGKGDGASSSGTIARCFAGIR